ncbi:hypothetical protein [Paenibacillus naphthalenovorans]|uniref:hypothetical protein n=1 Tax=Paenibacillus naphthalenovorans TaxID=162209 RepID=UPI003D290B09
MLPEDPKRLRKTYFLYGFLLFFIVFGQRFALPLGDKQLPMIIPVIYGVIIILIIQKTLVLDKVKFILFYLFTVLMLSLLLFQNEYSHFSVIYILICYAPFVLIQKEITEKLHRDLLILFQKLMFAAAMIGIIQFVLQVVHIWKFQDYFNLLPAQFVQQHYQNPYPIQWGSSIYKSNGIFFLEPSFYSQFLAVAIIIELIYFKRIKSIFIYLLGLLSSFSGTGILLLCVSVPFIIYRMKLWKLFVMAGVLFIFSFLYINSEYSSALISRYGEFNSSQSSAFQRFIGPYKAFDEIKRSDATLLIKGIGIGKVDEYDLAFKANFSTIAKLLYEYGLIVGIVFLIFIIYSMTRVESKALSFSFLFMYLILSGSLLQPQTIYLIYTLTLVCSSLKIEKESPVFVSDKLLRPDPS